MVLVFSEFALLFPMPDFQIKLLIVTCFSSTALIRPADSDCILRYRVFWAFQQYLVRVHWQYSQCRAAAAVSFTFLIASAFWFSFSCWQHCKIFKTLGLLYIPLFLLNWGYCCNSTDVFIESVEKCVKTSKQK